MASIIRRKEATHGVDHEWRSRTTLAFSSSKKEIEHSKTRTKLVHEDPGRHGAGTVRNSRKGFRPFSWIFRRTERVNRENDNIREIGQTTEEVSVEEPS
ncbi:hypothetical protein N7481_012858 [Penicillium waksmanii]|uniref:uncharacterized protein n=1 Tax=Penicillium waksmanii TaxID=69791 RepID=UPI002549442E|nr:uncharacterized protein N7481_012858 [Penicillium waksmanii]KAJ5966144.1 hypothetical protein N7481_012858 [Penicillium waksmanii]